MSDNISELFKFYKDYIKPIYFEIEARDNEIPIELLFEIHASFDHISRIYTDSNNEKEECNKASSHLKRGVLDAFKLKLKSFNKELKRLKNINFNLIDNGNFLSNYTKDHLHIIKLAKEARTNETKNDTEIAFDKWFEVSSLIDKFENNYIETEKIIWARKITKRYFTKNTLIGFILGVIGSIIASCIYAFLK